MDEWSQWCCWSDLERERAVKWNNCHYKCSAEPSCLCDTRHLLRMQDVLFSFFLLYLLLSPYLVWATPALYSFILHKLAEAICHKSSKNYIPQYVWQRAWAAQSNSVLARLWWLFFVDRDVSDIYFPTYLPPILLHPKARDCYLNDFRLQVYCWMFSTMGQNKQTKNNENGVVAIFFFFFSFKRQKGKCQHRKLTICK